MEVIWEGKERGGEERPRLKGGRGKRLGFGGREERPAVAFLGGEKGGEVAWWRELGDGTVARERKTTREGRGVLGRPAYWAAETRWLRMLQEKGQRGQIGELGPFFF